MKEEEQPQDMKQYYLLGLIVLVAVVVAGYMLRPKTNSVTSPTAETAPATLGPITALACDDQYYNQMIGFPKYYLSVEGGDVSTAKKVDCTVTVTVNDKEVASEKMNSPLTEKPQRGGSTFRCTSKALELEPNVPTKVDVVLKDDLKATATCSSTFLLPTP